jgi:hypothetical protein
MMYKSGILANGRDISICCMGFNSRYHVSIIDFLSVFFCVAVDEEIAVKHPEFTCTQVQEISFIMARYEWFLNPDTNDRYCIESSDELIKLALYARELTSGHYESARALFLEWMSYYVHVFCSML